MFTGVHRATWTVAFCSGFSDFRGKLLWARFLRLFTKTFLTKAHSYKFGSQFYYQF